MATASRPRTPSRTQPSSEVPAITENGNGQSKDQRRASSLGFLRRAKSTEPLNDRKLSGSKSKKRSQAPEEELRRQREVMPKLPPRLPDLAPAPAIESFGGDEHRDTPPVPSNEAFAGQQNISIRSNMSALAEPVDPYARTESMTHRGRYSYASSAVSTVNNPRRMRRRKDPTPYNILVIGARNSGKTSFLNFLRKSLTMPPHKHPSRSPEETEAYERQIPANEGFTSQYLETEIDGERVGLTLWDSQGLEKSIVDIQLRGVTGFLESKFEETLHEEMKVIRSPGFRDTHIHCTFLLLDPVRLDENIAAAGRAAQGTAKATDTPVIGILDEYLDIQVLRTVLGKTTIVPVISKADTITTAHMSYLKKEVWQSLKKVNIDPLEILTLEDQEEYTSSESDDEDEKAAAEATTSPNKEQMAEPAVPGSPSQGSEKTNRSSGSQAAVPHLPFSTLSPDRYSLEAGDQPVGRRFPWGFADPYNPEHCDFLKLKDSVFSDWRSELREASRVIWYERWRTSRLNRDGLSPTPLKKAFGGRTGPSDDGRRGR
ncbi:septin [Aspergillus clavatus NRRL 1]|uniref:Septin n=1 Tax=Aspergillus clavatus (strain ATCC 1007 / CBS 513.65 / DSM 816 / NCTC 3887 / NRRL 1 / QM 1276 / 107) TaxID=344612 RepID=A1CJH0_ASPCL|nr:septin [Aspergillus clavatus NRRL 1]EAW09294.1 septin [Aspergillus clavatus NRRL 1]